MNVQGVEVAGKVVVLTSESQPDDLLELVGQLREAGAQLVVLCPPGSTLQTFDEDEMAGAGWASVQRDGAVERWLRLRRDAVADRRDCWQAIDALLDDLREHADFGLPLSAPLPTF